MNKKVKKLKYEVCVIKYVYNKLIKNYSCFKLKNKKD